MYKINIYVFLVNLSCVNFQPQELKKKKEGNFFLPNKQPVKSTSNKTHVCYCYLNQPQNPQTLCTDGQRSKSATTHCVNKSAGEKDIFIHCCGRLIWYNLNGGEFENIYKIIVGKSTDTAIFFLELYSER